MKNIFNLFGKYRSAFAKYREQRMRELRHCDFNAQPIQWFTGPETTKYYDDNGKLIKSITVY